MNPTTAPGPRPAPARRGIVFQLAAVALVAVSALAATGLARWLRPHHAEQPKQPAAKAAGRLFKGWQDPDFVIVLSGQQYGYLQPCGCSTPQVGGLERRYNLLKRIEQKGWPYVAVDLGDIPQKAAPAGLPNVQGELKYVYSMKALKAMNYATVGFGEEEARRGLIQLFSVYPLNDDPRVVATNLLDEKLFDAAVVPWKPVDVKLGKGRTVRVGVAAITDPTIAERVKKLDKVRFGASGPTLDNVLKQFDASKVGLGVLLYQGPLTRGETKKEGAVACAEEYPQFPIVLCHSADDDAPPDALKVTTKSGSESLLITVGHKGKAVGVVGVWRTGDAKAPFRFEYQRVEMTEDFLTPEGKHKGHPIVALMEEYTRELRDQKYLEKYGQVRHLLQVMDPVAGLEKPGAVVYAGSQACKKCHTVAYDVWKESGHSHAYKTLADAKHPSNRQYDPECIVCHTVGFGTQSGFVSEKKTPPLKDVGCESCHGPASLHAANPKDRAWQKRINPWKYLPGTDKDRKLAIDQMCQKCHDQENDVHWTNGGFERKWPKVKHYSVDEEKGGEQP